uniref:RNA polymerase factor sigma-54 n=1 Tax=Cytobacillus oceanisediminis TaxID=665099 RepID=UPI0011A52ECB
EVAMTIMREDLVVFGEKKWKGVWKMVNIELKDMEKVDEEMEKVNAKGGGGLEGGKGGYIVGDVVVKGEGDDVWVRVYDGLIGKVCFKDGY